MSESLRDQLLKSGLAKPKPRKVGGAKPRKPAQKLPASGEPDLAQAYAMRARDERQETERSRREAEQKAKARKEKHGKLQQLLAGKNLIKADAELARHFEHRGKIRRVHLDSAQLTALNAGELGVVQFAGRYQLVAADVARKVVEIDADMLALLVEPEQGDGVDQDGIPDDLIW